MGSQLSLRVGGLLSTRNAFFNLGEYGIAAKLPSGRIALHLESFFNLGESGSRLSHPLGDSYTNDYGKSIIKILQKSCLW